MVTAKLHAICGNCGSTDLKYEHDDDIYHEEGMVVNHSNLYCDNCSTMHFLTEFPKKEKRKEQSDE